MSRSPLRPLSGAGLGLRRALIELLETSRSQPPDFYEVAPENWIKIGGRFRRRFDAIAECSRMICHGLSLSLGSPDPIDWEFLKDVRDFIQRYRVSHYSEHLSYCSDGGHLYDLAPLPFTEEAVYYVAERIRQVQDFLGRRIGIENISYYAAADPSMTEADFVAAVLDEADCELLLDVNNVYVNSINHGYDPCQFLDTLVGRRICYFHIAGHYDEAEDLKIDTHGADVIDQVWDLLGHAYRLFGVQPTLLERDFNFPTLEQLLIEVDRIRHIQSAIEADQISQQRVAV